MKHPPVRLVLLFAVGCLSCWLLGCASVNVELPGVGVSPDRYAQSFPIAENDWGKTGIYPELRRPEVLARRNVGVCFSGGGSLSATATHGQMRALRDLGLLDQVRYLSSVSGGSWGSVPWTFLDQEEETFFTPYIEPENMRLADFSQRPAAGSFVATLSDFSSQIPLRQGIVGDEFYADIVDDWVLEGHIPPNNKRRFVALDDEMVADIIGRNPSLTPADFITPADNRPFHIVNGVVVARRPDLFGLRNYFDKVAFTSLEMTPWYTGIRAPHVESFFFPKVLGGGFVETFGYDSCLRQRYPKNADGTQRVRVRMKLERNDSRYSRFSISDMVGVSGSAPTVLLPGLSEIFGYPEHRYWSPSFMKPQTDMEFRHTDGGGLENSGIAPLLARRVENIVVFSNASGCYDPLKRMRGGEAVRLLGGFEPEHRELHVLERFDLEDGHDKLVKLQAAFDEDYNNGRPLVHYDRYRVVPNQKLGVGGNYEVNIAWFLLGPHLGARDAKYQPVGHQWFNQLSEPLQAQLGRRRYQRLPNVPIFFPNLRRGLKYLAQPQFLDPKEVFMISQFSSYMVQHEADSLRTFFQGELR